MSFWDNVKKFAQPYSDEDYDDYDEDEEYYTCAANLDEDEMYRFLTGSCNECPYYSSNDEYAVVRHQM